MPFDSTEGEFEPVNGHERSFEDKESNASLEGPAGEMLSTEVQEQLARAIETSRKSKLTPEETAQVLEAIEAAGLQPGEFAAEVAQAQKECTPEEVKRSRESYKALLESAGDAKDITDFLAQIEFASRSFLETPEGEAAFKECYGEGFDHAKILEQIRAGSTVPPVPGASWAREVFDTKKYAVFEADLVRIVEREALAGAVERYASAYGSGQVPLETASGSTHNIDAIELAAAIRVGEFELSGDVALDAAYRAVVNAEQGGRDKVEERVAGRLQHNMEARPASGSDRVSYAEALEKLHIASGAEECARVLQRHLLIGELVLVPTDQEEGKEYPSRPLGTFPNLKKELLAIDLSSPTGAHQFLVTLKRGSFDPKWGTQYVVGEKLTHALAGAEGRVANQKAELACSEMDMAPIVYSENLVMDKLKSASTPAEFALILQEHLTTGDIVYEPTGGEREEQPKLPLSKLSTVKRALLDIDLTKGDAAQVSKFISILTKGVLSGGSGPEYMVSRKLREKLRSL